MTITMANRSTSGRVLDVVRVPYVARRGPASAQARWSVLAEHVLADGEMSRDPDEKHRIVRRRQKRRQRSRHR